MPTQKNRYYEYRGLFYPEGLFEQLLLEELIELFDKLYLKSGGETMFIRYLNQLHSARWRKMLWDKLFDRLKEFPGQKESELVDAEKIYRRRDFS